MEAHNTGLNTLQMVNLSLTFEKAEWDHFIIMLNIHSRHRSIYLILRIQHSYFNSLSMYWSKFENLIGYRGKHLHV